MRVVLMLVTVALAICVTVSNRSQTSNETARVNTTSSFHVLSPKLMGPKPKPTKPLSASCYTYWCNCNGDRTECTGAGHRHITYLPRVPAETRLFRMWRADLRTLTSHMLANLSNFDIETLDLAANNISHVEKDAFKEFTKLKKLILSGNPIAVADLQQAFLSMSKVLDKIYLDKMNFTHLPVNFFEGFSNRTFTMVNLQNNNLIVLDNSVFAKFWRIETLDISGNRISSVKLTQRVHVQRLKLENSALTTVPDFCLQRTSTRHNETEEEGGDETESAFINLLSLSLGNGIFQEIPLLRGKCLPNLEKLDVSGAAVVDSLPDNFIADLPALHFLIVSKMSKLTHYGPYAFNSSSLKNLTLSQNRVMDAKKGKNLQPDQFFRHCPNLEDLSIIDTKINLDERDFRALLAELKSIQTLYLNANTYGNIPEDLLWRLSKLKRLIYTGNSMVSRGLERALINVTTLEYLNVQANSITVVNETTLPWEFRRNVKEINLAQNPFLCACDLLWFRKWLDDVGKNKSIKISNYPSWQYRCRTPEALKYKPLAEFRPTDESCAIKNPYIVIGLVIGCLIAMVTVTGGLCYRYRWHLRFYVYRLRRRTRYRQVFEANADGGGEVIPVYNYDVYMAHSASDLEWIQDELLPLLEGEHNLKTFVEERDTVGGYVGDNIARYMDDSARIMLVLSDNYNHEGWRKCEFEHILYSVFEFNKDVIVLLLGEVEAGRMTKDMCSMLTRGTFLQWGPSEDAKRQFRDGLKVALKTQDVNFAQIVC